MRRRWSQLLGWRRVLVVLNALVILDVIAWFLFDFSFLSCAVPAVIIVCSSFALLALERRRRLRDGSYWGPRS